MKILNKPKQIILVVGLPNCGKTTLLSKFPKNKYYKIDNKNPYEHFPKYEEFNRLIIADSFLTSKKNQIKIIDKLNELYSNIIIKWIFFANDKNTCLKNYKLSPNNVIINNTYKLSNRYFIPTEYRPKKIFIHPHSIKRKNDIIQWLSSTPRYQDNGYFEKTVAPYEQDDDINKLAIQRDTNNIKFILNQTDELVKLTIDCDCKRGCNYWINGSYRYVRNQTTELNLYAVKKHPSNLYHIKNKTYEVCFEAVKNDPKLIGIVPNKLISDEMMTIAYNNLYTIMLELIINKSKLTFFEMDKFASFYNTVKNNKGIIDKFIPLFKDMESLCKLSNINFVEFFRLKKYNP